MSTSLPLNQSSSVFVRTDEDKIHFMTALITGWVKGIAILFWLAGCLAGCLAVCLAGRLFGCLSVWPTSFLAGCLAVCLSARLPAGRQAGLLSVWPSILMALSSSTATVLPYHLPFFVDSISLPCLQSRGHTLQRRLLFL